SPVPFYGSVKASVFTEFTGAFAQQTILPRKYPQRVGKMQQSFFAVRSTRLKSDRRGSDTNFLNGGAKQRVYLPSTGEKSADRFSLLRWSASCNKACRGTFHMPRPKVHGQRI